MSANDKIDPNSVTAVYATDDPATVAAYRQVLAEMQAFDERLRGDLNRLGATKIAYVPGPNGERGDNVGLIWAGRSASPTGWKVSVPPRVSAIMLIPVDGCGGAEARRWLAEQVRPDRHAVMAEHGLPHHPQTEPKIEGGARTLLMEWDGTVWAAYRDAPESAPTDHWTPRTADGSPWPEPQTTSA